MTDRTGHYFKLFGTRLATLCVALSVLVIAPDAGWTQTGTVHEAEMFLIKGLLERD